ncbi:hypothetical protein ANO11243_093430 [Dothideomycetidae sp. 11243]|nr:hypothetical protein ANO11243_093430 [fungal sp. No.11243]
MRLFKSGLALVSLLSIAKGEPSRGAPDDHDSQELQFALDPADKYIVTLKPNVDVQTHVRYVHALHSSHSRSRGIMRQYETAGFQGYNGHFNQSFIQQLREHKDVASVEADQGLGHISHWALRYPKSYVYDDSAGEGTYAYNLDTGINERHADFEGRARLGVNALPASSDKDIDGHGTHTAGVIGSKTFGVARKCNIIAVKVSNGDGTLTGIALDGYAWAVKDILRRKRESRSVINIAMSGPPSDAFNLAINNAFTRGIITVVAAGNENRNAANFSPAQAKGAIVVAATDARRQRAAFSNYGSAVSLYAPGVDIPSTWIGSAGAAMHMSGTSVAAAHVAGIVLYLRRLNPKLADPLACRRYIINTATTEAVVAPKTAPNKFAYNMSGQ